MYGNGLTTTRSYYSTSKRLQTISVRLGLQPDLHLHDERRHCVHQRHGHQRDVNVTYDNLHRIKTFTGLDRQLWV